MLTYAKNLLQLLFFPEKGWTDIVCSTASAGALYRNFFMPIVILASASSFVRIAYGADVIVALQEAIVNFFSLFLAYHVACLALDALMLKVSRKQASDPTRQALFTAYSLAVVALITIVGNAVPVKLALIQFLPLYVAFIIWKGCAAMEVADGKQPQFTAMASIAILGTAYLFGFCFNLFI